MRIGIDLGGTKIEGLLRSDDGEDLRRYRVNTPHHDYGQIVNAVSSMVESLRSEAEEACSVGVGTPGAICPRTNLMKNSNTLVLNGRPLLEDLRKSIGSQLVLANDANCFAVSEATLGAATQHDIVFGVILGTGTGGGLVFHKRPHEGTNAIAGEWGHNPLPYKTERDGLERPCYCGKSDCVETYLSGSGLSYTMQQMTKEKLQPPEIVELARKGDIKAFSALELYVDQLARCLSVVINILDPDAVVLGGGMSNISLILEQLPSTIEKYLFTEFWSGKILPASLGDSSGVYGAAMLTSSVCL